MPDAVDDDPRIGLDGQARYADDDPDAWVVCPECGSEDAYQEVYPVRGGRTGERTFICPDCDRRS